MATRSTIAVLKHDGSVMQIYSHWDGYPSHNGMLLKNHYNTQELAESLIAGGDISVLDKSIELVDGHTFDNRVDGHTLYYKRDRGESNVDAKKFDNYVAFLKLMMKEEYNYIFIDGQWKLIINKKIVDYNIDTQ